MAEPGKTEKPTPKKKEEARKKGQVAKSQEINSTLNVLAGFVILLVAGEYMMFGIKQFAAHYWGNAFTYKITEESVIIMMQSMTGKLLMLMAPMFAAVFITAVISNIIQVGFHITFEPLKPKISNINPVQGMKRMFSLRSLVELIKSIIKIAIIGYIFWSTVRKVMNDIFMTPLMDMETYFSFAAGTALKLAAKIVGAFIVFSLVDFLYQKWQYNDNLKMSKQEVKDEYKQLEGDPLIKSRIRSIQREMARKRMISEIPQADVVITNPTHVAVALKYDESGEKAPFIVAKGMNFMAEKIKEIARKNRVVIVENPPLARTLVKLELGWEIPPEMFQAVAEILAFVYQTKGKIRLDENEKKVDNKPLRDDIIPYIGGS
jgi:flagellar biosynthetic protein FlhB